MLTIISFDKVSYSDTVTLCISTFPSVTTTDGCNDSVTSYIKSTDNPDL